MAKHNRQHAETLAAASPLDGVEDIECVCDHCRVVFEFDPDKDEEDNVCPLCGSTKYSFTKEQ